jgi:hypothetical protein
MTTEPELSVDLTINGKKVEMNEFVHRIAGNVLWGMVKSLRLEANPRMAMFSLKIN